MEQYAKYYTIVTPNFSFRTE